MKYIYFLLLSSLVVADEVPQCTKKGDTLLKSKQNTQVSKKINCRWVCDKKLYKEQKIADAISFYKNSKEYNFSKKSF